MTLNLTEDSIDSENVVENVVEEDELDVEFLLVEDAKSSLDVLSKLLSFDWKVVSRRPVGVEDGSSEGLLVVDGREVSESRRIDVLVRPELLRFRDESILEEPESFVGPDPNESFDRERFERSKGFVDSSHPSSELSRTVDVVGLNVGGESFLGGEVEVDHGVREGLGVGSKVGNDLEEGSVEGSVDLFEGDLSWVVNHDEGSVSKEPMGERDSTRICRRVASSDELDPLESDPRHVARPPESSALDELTNEGDDSLGSVLVDRGKVDLVAEEDEPPTDLDWGEDDAVGSLPVLAVLLEGLEDEFRSRRRREVESDDLELWEFPKSTEERHRLS